MYLKALLDAEIDNSMLKVFTPILLIGFLPLVLGSITQCVLIAHQGEARFNGHDKPKLPPFSALGVLGIVFVSMVLKSQAIVCQPALLLSYRGPLVLRYALNFLISTLLGKALFARSGAIALVYDTVMRHLSIALAIAIGVFGEQGTEGAWLIAPTYTVQVQAAAWYVKLTDRLFGALPTARPA